MSRGDTASPGGADPPGVRPPGTASGGHATNDHQPGDGEDLCEATSPARQPAAAPSHVCRPCGTGVRVVPAVGSRRLMVADADGRKIHPCWLDPLAVLITTDGGTATVHLPPDEFAAAWLSRALTDRLSGPAAGIPLVAARLADVGAVVVVPAPDRGVR